MTEGPAAFVSPGFSVSENGTLAAGTNCGGTACRASGWKTL